VDVEDLQPYDAALRYLETHGRPERLIAASDTSCIPVPLATAEPQSANYAVHPEPSSFAAEFAVEYGRKRLEACQRLGTPLVTRTERGVQFAFDEPGLIDAGPDFEDVCQTSSERSASWQDAWQARYASEAGTVAEADWLIYFSPPCGDTLVAAVYSHWDRPSPWSYHYFFTFDERDSLSFAGVTRVHHSVPPPPLRGWPK
jgi:hypothetical protein